jgi:hypothetical protein
MSEPEYRRAFEQDDFRGYFKWTRKLTSRLGGSLYHACHKQALTNILENGELGLRSKWSLKLPKYGEWSAPGTWVGLLFPEWKLLRAVPFGVSTPRVKRSTLHGLPAHRQRSQSIFLYSV